MIAIRWVLYAGCYMLGAICYVLYAMCYMLCATGTYTSRAMHCYSCTANMATYLKHLSNTACLSRPFAACPIAKRLASGLVPRPTNCCIWFHRRREQPFSRYLYSCKSTNLSEWSPQKWVWRGDECPMWINHCSPDSSLRTAVVVVAAFISAATARMDMRSLDGPVDLLSRAS